MSSIPLVKSSSSWFSHSKCGPTIPAGTYNYAWNEFVNLLPDQIMLNLTNKKCSFGWIGNTYYIQEIKVTLEQEQFNKFVQNFEAVTNDILPFLSYHSTQNQTKVNSILKYGYLLPGQRHPSQNWTLRMHNGNVYGDGIYSATHFDTALWFGYLDRNSATQLIVNLVCGGRVKNVSAGSMYPYNKNHSLSYDGVIPELDIHSEIYVQDSETFHSLNAINNPTIWVSSSSKYIIPVAVVVLTPNLNSPVMKKYLNWGRNGKCYNLCDIESFLPNPKSLNPINCTHFVGDYWFITAPEPHPSSLSNYYNTTNLEPIRNLFMCPSFYATNKRFVETINNFTSSLDTVYGMFYGADTCTKIKKITIFEQFAQKIPVKQTNYEKLFTPLNRMADWATSSNAGIDIVWIWINNPEPFVLDDFIAKWKLYFKVRKTIFKIIFLNGMTNDILTVKSELQVQWPVEKYWHETTIESLADTCDELMDEFQNISFVQSRMYQVPFPLGIVGEGFVTDQSIDWDLNSDQTVMFKGQLPNFLKVDDTYYSVELGPTPIETQCRVLIQYLGTVRNFVFRYRERCARYKKIVEEFCRLIIERLTYGIEDQTLSLSFCKGVRWGFRRLLSDIEIFGGVKFEGEWYQKLIAMKFAKNIMKRVKNEYPLNMVIELVPRSAKKIVRESADALVYSKRTGLMVRIVQSQSAMVQPWNLMIGYVSMEKAMAGSIYKSTECGEKLTDSNGYGITDIVPDVIDSVLDSMMVAYAFTRVPYLVITGQTTAMVVITWCRLIEQAFIQALDEDRYGTKSDHEYIHKAIKTAWDMIPRVQTVMDKSDQVKSAMGQIIEETNFEKYLTTKYCIQSLVQILGVLTRDEFKSIFSSNKYDRFCFALLVEATIRACRANLSSSKQSIDEMLRNALGLGFKTDLTRWSLNKKRIVRLSTKFFFHSFTNSSPFVIVAVMGLLEYYHRGGGPEDFANGIINRTVSMGSFLRAHLPGLKGAQVQTALYLNGIQNCRNREDMAEFTNVPIIINNIIIDQKNKIIARQSAQKRINEQKSLRKRKDMEMAQKYLEYHTFPTIFTHKQVTEMNEKRSRNNQLTLMPSGLLLHHCCYPNCPHYLERFASENDLASTMLETKYWRRNQLMKHLKYDAMNANKIKAFHINAQCFKHLAWPEFIVRMTEAIGQKQINQRGRTIFEQEVREIWLQLNNDK